MKKFRKPEHIDVEKDRKVNLSCRVRSSVKDKLLSASMRTPKKLPIAVFVEQILEDYIRFLDEEKGRK